MEEAKCKDNTKEWSCYILGNTLNNRTYAGATNCFLKRFRAHMKLIAGGALQTSMLPEPGRWHPIVEILGFHSKRQALQFERCLKQNMAKYRTKHLTKAENSRLKKLCCGQVARIFQLLQVLSLDQWTSNAVKSDQVPLTIVWYSNNCNPEEAKYRPSGFKEEFLQNKAQLKEIIHPGIIDECTTQIYTKPGSNQSHPFVTKILMEPDIPRNVR